MNTLIFITSHFPYEPGEEFIETEFPYLHSAFSRVIIITRNVKDRKLRSIPDDVKVYRYDPASSLTGYLALPALFSRNFRMIRAIYRDETGFRSSVMQPLTFRQRLYLLKKIIKGLQLRDFIDRIIIRDNPEGEVVLYSYWLNNGAHAISMLESRNRIRIARAHRIDLYEEATDENYLPLLRYSFHNLDAIFFISEHGKRYFESRLGESHPKNQVSRLGILKPSADDISGQQSGSFRIVSCSGLIKVKRVELIISALSLLKTSRKITWNHFGDGELHDHLEEYAKKCLGQKENISYRFMGQVSNQTLLEFYAGQKPDLFINTSASEGIPVSIMEAQSYGIPVVATDVGGVREVVPDGCGELLPVDFEISGLAEAIRHYAELPENDINRIRINAFNNWKSNFNAAENYKDFVIKVNSILASEKSGS
jgi:glycosyltransferase involved in cell wall biosynthesis